MSQKVMVDDSPDSIEDNHRRKVRLVLKKSVGAYIERRCHGCGRLLMKEVTKSQRSEGSIQILCHKCKTLNNI